MNHKFSIIPQVILKYLKSLVL